MPTRDERIEELNERIAELEARVDELAAWSQKKEMELKALQELCENVRRTHAS